MKTHDFADALSQLARLLKQSPDTELSPFLDGIRGERPARESSADEVALSLSTLAALSQIDKDQWIALIREYGLPIELRPRISSRDILGKLLSYLENNPAAMKKMRQR